MRALKARNINFVERIGDDPRRDEQDRKRLTFIAPLAVFAVVLLVFVGYFQLYRIPALNAEYEAAADYLANPDIAAKYNEYLYHEAEKNALEEDVNNLTAVKNNLATYPEMSVAIYNDFTAKAGALSVTVEAFSYNRDDGELVLSCVTRNPDAANAYVDTIRGSEYCAKAGYYGYTGGSATSQEYTFTVTITLTPREAGGAK